MLYPTVSLKRSTSCVTSPICPRRDAKETSRISWSINQDASCHRIIKARQEEEPWKISQRQRSRPRRQFHLRGYSTVLCRAPSALVLDSGRRLDHRRSSCQMPEGCERSWIRERRVFDQEVQKFVLTRPTPTGIERSTRQSSSRAGRS